MARPRSDDKREAILEAAIEVIAAQGLSAPTATIARAAGVASGTLFTYFETKADLWNVLYTTLKAEMSAATSAGIGSAADPKQQLLAAWTGWLGWATDRPERRKVMLLLGTSEEITRQSRRIGQQGMAPMAELVERCRANGPMRDASPALLFALLNATAEATIDVILSDPTNTTEYTRDGFEAAWRIIA